MTERDAPSILIRREGGSIELLKDDLDEVLGQESSVSLHLKTPDAELERSAIDPTVLVALIAAAGVGLPKLIEGLFGLLTTKEKIVLKGKSGRSVEIPANTPDDRLPELIDMAKELDVAEITLRKL
jgi:hypothetical protein